MRSSAGLKTFNSPSTSLHSGVQIGTVKLSGKSDENIFWSIIHKKGNRQLWVSNTINSGLILYSKTYWAPALLLRQIYYFVLLRYLSKHCWFVVAVCLPPEQQGNGKWTPEKLSYNIGATVWLNCATGYQLTDPSVSSVTCGKDTQWSTPTPTCQGTWQQLPYLACSWLFPSKTQQTEYNHDKSRTFLTMPSVSNTVTKCFFIEELLLNYWTRSYLYIYQILHLRARSVKSTCDVFFGNNRFILLEVFKLLYLQIVHVWPFRQVW